MLRNYIHPITVPYVAELQLSMRINAFVEYKLQKFSNNYFIPCIIICYQKIPIILQNQEKVNRFHLHANKKNESK